MKSLIVISSAFLLLLSCGSLDPAPEEAVYLLPKGYVGPVIIFFAQKDEIKAEYEGKKHVYRIPNSGVLKTQFEANYKMNSQVYYYVDSVGNRAELKYLHYKDYVLADTNGIYCYNLAMSSTPNNKPNFTRFRTFFVGKLQAADSLQALENQILFDEFAE